MTQVFTEDGVLIPVTVVEATPNVVLQKKTVENDGYEAVQLGFEDVKERRATKANVGHAKKANTAPKRFVKEIRDCELELNVGDTVKVDIFEAGETVDVIGTSKGKGYNGTIVRNNAHQGPKSHGGSKNIRHIGSLATNGITSRQGRILKGYDHGRSGRRIQNNKPEPDSHQGRCRKQLPVDQKEMCQDPKRGMVMVRTAKCSKGNKAPVTLVDYTKAEEE